MCGRFRSTLASVTRVIPIRHRVRTTAFHEAGHTFAAVHFGIPFLNVWILQRTDYENRAGENLGQLTRITPVNKSDYFGKIDEAKAEATLAFCGPLAECLAYPGQLDPGLQTDNQNDWIDARSILRFATTPCTPTNHNPFRDEDLNATKTQVDQLLNECGHTAEALVNENREAITRLAEALLAQWDISAEEVKRLMTDISPT